MKNIKTRGLEILFLALLIGAVVLALSVVRFAVLPGEESIERAVKSIDHPAFEGLMKVTTFIASQEFSIIIIAILFVLLWFRGHKPESVFIIIAGLNGIFCAIIKVAVQRIRPSWGEIATFWDYSFPSGHVMNLVVLYGFIIYVAWILWGNVSSKRAFLLFLLIFLVVFTGVSRIYLGAHWFSDVIGAYLFGGCYLVALIWSYKHQKAKRKKFNTLLI